MVFYYNYDTDIDVFHHTPPGGGMEDIQNLIGKEVEAVANGIQYYGVLIEVSEDEVYLKTPLQWVVLSATDVSFIKLKGAVDMEPERVGQEEFSPEEIEEIEEVESEEKGA